MTSLEIINLCEKANIKDACFPNGICEVTNLNNIKFSGFIFKTFPINFSDLVSVKELDLSNNAIDTLPSKIEDLTELKSL